MKTLAIAKDLKLPLDVVTQTFLIVGKRGSGKSNTAARLVEQLHGARIPFVVLDPVDTWWGLKAGKAGGRGLDVYVFGGAKQDLPLEPGAGAMLAEVLCEHRVPMVLSVKHLSGRERSAFMVAFAQTLFQRWQGGPLHIVLEEAHEFAPQMAGGRSNNTDGESAMLGAFKRLWKLGRASGIGGTAITQRPASLSKDITTQSEILIAHRTIGPQDVAAIGQWVKYHGEREETLADLPSLPTGQAFVWAPEFPSDKPLGLMRTGIYLRETYDSAATPKVGEKRVEPKELAPVDLERLRTKMAATIERAKADDPRELKKQLATLRAELAKKDRTLDQVDVQTKRIEQKLERVAEPKVVEKKVIGPKEAARLEGAVTNLERLRTVFADLIERADGIGQKARDVLADIQKTAGDVRQLLAPAPAPPRSVDQGPHADLYAGRSTQARATAPIQRREIAERQPAGDGISPTGQRILDAMLELEVLGAGFPQRTLVALMAGYTNLKSTGFVKATSGLSSGGYVTYPTSDTIALTDAGRSAATTVTAPGSAEEVQARVIQILGGKTAEILKPIIAAYPRDIEREAVAGVAGYSNLKSTGYVKALSKLSSLGFVTYPTTKTVKASPVLFLEESL